jgi:hypothetical protein
VGLKKAIGRNKRFFQSWKLETTDSSSKTLHRKYQYGFDRWCKKFDLLVADIRL